MEEQESLFRQTSGGIECVECKKETMLRQAPSHYRNCTVKIGFGRLTPREMEVCVELANGLNCKEIAEKLQLATKTIETHKWNIMQKLNVHSTSALVRKYIYEIEIPSMTLASSPISPMPEQSIDNTLLGVKQ
jgi:DNA-binding NarL/FixJ family response regulator